MLLHAVFIQKLYIERFGEILTEIVRGACLQALAVLHHCFHSVGSDSACEFFFFCLFARYYGNCKAVFGKFLIHAEHFHSFLFRLLLCCVSGVPLLPQKFGGAQKRSCSFFPAHNVCPLVYKHGQISVRLNPLGIHTAEDGFGRGADSQRFGKLFTACVGNDGDFGSEAFYMFGFLSEKAHRNEQGKISVSVTRGFETAVKFGLYIFPNSIAVGTDYHSSLNGAVVDESRFYNHVGIPTGKIFFDVCDLFYKIILCHFSPHAN